MIIMIWGGVEEVEVEEERSFAKCIASVYTYIDGQMTSFVTLRLFVSSTREKGGNLIQ